MSMIKLSSAGMLFGLLCLIGRPVEAQAPDVKMLGTKDVAGAAGKETVVLTIAYPPGVSGAGHRHNGQAFTYVLEGSLEMQVKGQPPVTLQPGDTFYEGPDDVHVVGRNASKTQQARFVVFLIKEKGAPVTVPVQ